MCAPAGTAAPRRSRVAPRRSMKRRRPNAQTRARIASDFARLLDSRPFPFPRLKTPRYRAGQYGAWSLTTVTDHFAAVGYFRGMQWVDGTPQYVLRRGREVWMSISPMELESQALHLHAAHGDVVIAGLGMGALVYNVLQKPEVTHVTVVERDHEVVALLYEMADLKRWPGAEKLSIVIED